VGEIIETRVEYSDWACVSTISTALRLAMFRNLLTADECKTIACLYAMIGTSEPRRHGTHALARRVQILLLPLPDIVARLAVRCTATGAYR